MSYKMKHSKSAFPFKSPVKQNERAVHEGDPGHPQRPTTPDSTVHENIYDPSRDFAANYNRTYWSGSQRKNQEPTPTPDEYLAQGLNRWGGTDMSI